MLFQQEHSVVSIPLIPFRLACQVKGEQLDEIIAWRHENGRRVRIAASRGFELLVWTKHGAEYINYI